MKKIIKNFNLKHLIFNHNNKNIMVCDNTESLTMLRFVNINRVILFNSNYIMNNFNNNDGVIKYVKQKYLD